MARFHGKQGKHAMRAVRAEKHAEALIRNHRTPMKRQKWFRLAMAEGRGRLESGALESK